LKRRIRALILKVGLIYTVKASNFKPHGNYGTVLARSVGSSDEYCTKHEQNKAFESEVSQQLSIPSYFL
jgi:hypothetical protein